MGYCTQTFCVAFLRFIQAVCLVLVVSFVAVPNFQCQTSNQSKVTTRNNGTGAEFTAMCQAADSPLSINHWSDGVIKELQGQYFVFISALIFALVSLGMIFASCCSCEATKQTVVVICGFGAFILFIAGIVEAWYASGFGKVHYIDMWIAASALCFFAALLYVIDIAVTQNGSEPCM